MLYLNRRLLFNGNLAQIFNNLRFKGPVDGTATVASPCEEQQPLLPYPESRHPLSKPQMAALGCVLTSVLALTCTSLFLLSKLRPSC